MRLPSIALAAYTANIPLKQRVTLGVIFVILVGLVYWQLFLRSEWAARNEAQAELTRLRAEAERSRQIASQKPHLKQEIKLLEARLQRAVQQLPAEKEIPSLLKRVAGLGHETDLDVSLFKPGTPVAKEFYTEIPVQLKVVGTYHDLGLLFERLSRLERIVNVADLTIRPAIKAQKAGPSIQAEFGVVTYTYSGTSGAKSVVAASTAK
ncbi:type 4a pilus biogenesis protein PilO [Candidatus Methylomirabilis sp.]|uniref:type 4a pilus biogenesis protein PilO n=1 Tax=Candidatus Methylomirabilis sp. TaxID=2032687 RepID=UPI002A60C883|nr:type 4a pilus biogenesis protein PilO [Candidatus Methylomirabilis sp.]